MYERKIPLDLNCGVHLAREVLTGKWKMDLLYHLAQGIRRPGQLHRKLRGATRRVIQLQFKQLEAHELLTKTVVSEKPLQVDYHLTALGETLLPVIALLGQWGEMHREHLHRVLATQPPAAGWPRPLSGRPRGPRQRGGSGAS